MLYNNDSLLWENYRKSQLAKGARPVLTVTIDGSLTHGGEYVARCADKATAQTMLAEAGWRHLAGNPHGTFYVAQ